MNASVQLALKKNKKYLALEDPVLSRGLWLTVESGRTCADAVRDLAVFEVITEILLQNGLALNCAKD